MSAGHSRFLVTAVALAAILGGCAGVGTTAPPSAGATPTKAPATATPTVAPATATAGASATAPASATIGPSASPDPNDLLAIIKARGEIVMSTDPAYPPQSSLDEASGNYVGFDIDVGKEIARRLGVTISFQTPDWEVITAGSWAGRWDFSVGSMTITSARQRVLDFTQPYYYTPAQMAASTASGITTLDGLAGKTICVGASTTYFDWLNGKLDFGSESPQTKPPAGAVATTLSTDRKCANAWKNGREDFDGWLSSITTVEKAIDDNIPCVKVGDPVFYEPLAVAVDKGGTPHAQFLAALDKIVGDMHADGTLSSLSKFWFKGFDYTVRTGQ
jgi:polar amino acid transport system substrate-binding protein